MHLLAFFVDPEVSFRLGLVGLGLGCHARHQRRHGVHAHVQFGVVLGLARNDERRAGLVDQDRIDLVDNGIGKPALTAVFGAVFHVVAQVIEAVFIVGAVG